MGDFAQCKIGHAVKIKIREMNYFSIARLDLIHLDYVNDTKRLRLNVKKTNKHTKSRIMKDLNEL